MTANKSADATLFARISYLGQRVVTLKQATALLRKTTAAGLSAVLVLQPALVHAQIAPDVGVPRGNQPGVGAAANGVPMIDIVAPNNAGLSHNKYRDFNVGTSGLIFNNLNAEYGVSRLGGVTPGNANLRGTGPATVILNEVTSSSRSALMGPMEVFGGRADVIVANPNGITCNGCGFINTPRATLTTGTPELDTYGRLSGFNVQRGEVTFGERGGNFATGEGAVDLFDIVSRSVKLNGPVAARHLRVSTGHHSFDYHSGAVSAYEQGEAEGEYAIDGSSLGAMQADRIKIIVTDKGAGVRMRSDMAANAGELSLSADGKITLNHASGHDGVSIHSSSQNVVADRLTSKKDITVKAAKGVELNTIAAERHIDVTAGYGLLSIAADATAGGDLRLETADRIAAGNLAAGSDIAVTAKGSITAQSVNGNANTSVISEDGNIDVSSTVRAGGGDLVLETVAGHIHAGSTLSFHNTSLTAGRDLVVGDAILSGGALVATASSIKATNAISGVDFAASQATPDGRIVLGRQGGMQLSATGSDPDGMIDIGTMLSAGDLTASALSVRTQSVQSHGSIAMNGNLDLSGQMLAAGDVVIKGAGNANSSITAQSIIAGVDFAASEAAADGSVVLNKSGNLSLDGGNGSIIVGSLLAAGSINASSAELIADTITSHGTTHIEASTTIHGQLLAGQSISVEGQAITIGAAVAGVDLGALVEGRIALGNTPYDLVLNASGGDLLASQLQASGSVRGTAAGNLTANVVAHNDLFLTAGNRLTLKDQSLAGGDATLRGKAVAIETLVSGVDFAATAQSGGALLLKNGAGSPGKMQLTATEGTITANQLVSGQDFAANAWGDLVYQSLNSFGNAALASQHGTISIDRDTIAKGDIALDVQDLDLSNNRSRIATAGTLSVNANTISIANSTLTFGGVNFNLAGALDATNGKLRAVRSNKGNGVGNTTGDIRINASSVRGDYGTAILAAHDLTLNLVTLTNSGQLAANNDLAINLRGDLTNTSTGLIYADGNANLFVDGTITNSYGAIMAGKSLALANLAGSGKNAAIINTAGLIRAGENLTIQTQYLKNEANGTPVIGERVDSGQRYGFATPEHYDELWDNDTLMAGKLFYDPSEAIRWGRGACSGKHGDPCDVTWLDKGIWQNKEETFGLITMPDGTVYKAFTWTKAGSNDAKGKIWYDWNDQASMREEFQSQYFISKPTIQGLIQSDGDMTINATTIDNLYSAIEAGGNADITSDVLTNKGVTLYRDVYMTCLASSETCYSYNKDGTRNAAGDISANSSVFVKREAVDSLSSIVQAGGTLNLNVGLLDNTAAEGSVAGNATYQATPSTGDPLDALKGLTAGGALFTPKFDLDGLSGPHVDQALLDSIRSGTGLSAPKPDSGGFGGTLPNQNFIYETRAEFLDVSRFYGSGYYLDRIGYKPDHQVLFLGDAYFENQLIDKQMRDATGQGLARGSADPIDEMKRLIDQGVEYSQENGLAFGEPLTAEQIAALDQSIVVYVKQEIGGVEVFAPVLYVSAKDRSEVVASGAIVHGNDVVFAGDNLSNSGLIAANSDLKVSSSTITANGGALTSGGNLSLAATGNINLNAATTNFNGQSVVVPTNAVTAQGVARIEAGQDVSLSGVDVKTGGSLAISGENVNIGVANASTANGSQNVTGSSLSAGSDALIIARNDVSVTGSKIDAGKNLSISAEQGNLTIQSAEANRKDGFGETTTQQKSQLSSGGLTTLDAAKNVVIAGSEVKAGSDLSVKAGEAVAVIATQDSASGTFGSNSFQSSTQQGSELSAGGNATIAAGTDILLGASSLKAGGNVGLEAKGDVNIIAQANSNDEQTRGKIFNRDETSTTAVGSSITGGGNVAITAGADGAAKDINMIGSSIDAGGKASLNATNNINVLAAEDSHELHSTFSEKGSGPFAKTKSWSRDEAETTARGSSISGGAGIDITSGNNTTIEASKLAAGNDNQKADLNINAGGDLIIASGKDTVLADGSKSKSGFLNKKQDRSHSYDETTVASELGASGNVNLSADKNVVISGSKVKAGDSLAIAGDSVSIIGAQERHEHETSTKKTGIGVGSGDGFYSIYGSKEKISSETIVANTGSELSAGKDVSITAKGSDINIVGSKVEARNDISLDAARDVNILPGAESYQSSEQEKRSGFGVQAKKGEGSASIGIGYAKSKDETHQGSETNAVSTLKAGNDVKINAGRDANLQAAQVEADRNVAITAERDVNLLSAQDKTNYEHMHEELFAGVTAQVSTGVVGAAKSIGNAADKLGSVSDGYSAANAAFAGLKAIDGVKNLQNMADGKGNLVSGSIGIGFEQSKSKETAESSTPVTTDIRAGNNISIEAKNGDINSHGAQIAVGYDQYGFKTDGSGDISLKAGNDINLLSAQATENTTSSSSSTGASVGYSGGIGLSGASAGITGEVHGSKSNSESTLTTQVNTHVNGTGDIKIESGRDTNIKGGVVTGETITADVGRDLNIVSQADTGKSSNESTSMGVSANLSTPAITGISPGYGTGSGETNWISEQSGLVSKGKMDVTVEGNTHLGAGKIISENGDLTLDTGTLTHENFSGSKKYDGFDVNANIDLSGKDADGNKQQQPGQTTLPSTTAEGKYQLDDTLQDVRSTVGPGTIIIRDKDKQAELEASGQTASLDTLNRDPDKAYEITKDKHVEIDYYLSDTSLNAVASSIGKVMEPGGFVDRYLLGKNLTPEERDHIRDGLDAIANGGTFGGCGGQRQGFNKFSPFEWIVPSAYAYETSCYIVQKDGSKIELGIQTYKDCQDAIYAYLNTLSFEERVAIINSSGVAHGAGMVPPNGDSLVMTEWLWSALDKMDDKPNGYYFNQYLLGNADGYNSGVSKSLEWRDIMADPTLTMDQKAERLDAAGFDVGSAIAAATLGFASRGSTGRTAPLNLSEKLAMEQAMSHPTAGRPIPVPMTDKRWPSEQGWVKMAQNVNGVEIHYVRNVNTGQVDDFKFK